MPNYWDDILREDYATEAEPASTELNTLAKVLDAQAEGALEGIGVGCLGPADCVVTAGVGLSVEVASPRANVDTSVGVVFVDNGGTYTLTGLPANEAAIYIYVGAAIRVGPEDPDSREDAGALFTYNLVGGALADYLLIAHCATNGTGIVPDSIVDDRTFVAGQQAIADLGDLQDGIDAAAEDITELQDALGTDYFVGGEPVPGATSVTERLTDLEGGAGGVTYWGALEKTASDATSIDEAIAAAVGAGGGGGGGGGGETVVVQVPDAVSTANQLRLGLRLMHALPEVEQTQKWSYYFVAGISDDSLYDAVLTTATVDKVNHTIGA
jgi:hypothetical protein